MARSRQERHRELLALLQETGTGSVAELGVRLGVAEMTIRRDLEALEGEGVLKRFHGGAKLAFGSSYEPPLAVRERTNTALKQAIGHRVASLIDDGDTVVLDGGSTGMAVAQSLADRQVTVCPLSLRVAWAFERSTSVHLLLPGGTVRPGELSISGADASSFIRAHHFDHFVLTASGFTAAHGFSEWNVEDAAVKRSALHSSESTIAAIDSSKYGCVRFVHVCGVDEPQVVVTDDWLLDEQLEALRASARDVVVAPTGLPRPV